LDDPHFYGNSLIETVDFYIKSGYDFFFLDEVHKYPHWSEEIKNMHDTFRKIKIVFAGSFVFIIWMVLLTLAGGL